MFIWLRNGFTVSTSYRMFLSTGYERAYGERNIHPCFIYGLIAMFRYDYIEYLERHTHIWYWHKLTSGTWIHWIDLIWLIGRTRVDRTEISCTADHRSCLNFIHTECSSWYESHHQSSNDDQFVRESQISHKTGQHHTHDVYYINDSHSFFSCQKSKE